jgi:hypothetical protein
MIGSNWRRRRADALDRRLCGNFSACARQPGSHELSLAPSQRERANIRPLGNRSNGFHPEVIQQNPHERG